jgi:hypothetical protein
MSVQAPQQELHKSALTKDREFLDIAFCTYDDMQLATSIPIEKKVAMLIFSWEAVCLQFSERAEAAEKLNDRISKWNPDHPLTVKYKECWNRLYKNLQNPMENRLDSVFADAARLAYLFDGYKSLFPSPDPLPAPDHVVAINRPAAIAIPFPAPAAVADPAAIAIPLPSAAPVMIDTPVKERCDINANPISLTGLLARDPNYFDQFEQPDQGPYCHTLGAQPQRPIIKRIHDRVEEPLVAVSYCYTASLINENPKPVSKDDLVAPIPIDTPIVAQPANISPAEQPPVLLPWVRAWFP